MRIAPHQTVPRHARIARIVGDRRSGTGALGYWHWHWQTLLSLIVLNTAKCLAVSATHHPNQPLIVHQDLIATANDVGEAILGTPTHFLVDGESPNYLSKGQSKTSKQGPGTASIAPSFPTAAAAAEAESAAAAEAAEAAQRPQTGSTANNSWVRVHTPS